MADDGLGRGLGILSVALGVPQVAAPRAVARLIGLDGDGASVVAMRLVGARELAAAGGILARRRPVGWVWARVAGDVMDLALLGIAAANARRPARTAAACGVVAGALGADVVEAARLSRRSGGETADGRVHVRKAITVNRSADDVYAFWRRFENLPRFMAHLESVTERDDRRSHWVARGPMGSSVEWDAEIVDERAGELIAWRSVAGARVPNSGAVAFAPAPGNRGTEVTVELVYAPPAKMVGATIAKLLGADPSVQLPDDLRRFKQVIETGEVARSDATPGGHDLRQHAKQRPAQPVGEAP